MYVVCSSGVSLGIVVAVSIAGLVVLGGAIFCYVRRTLRQYVPVDVDPETAAKGDKTEPLSIKMTTTTNRETGQERHELLSQHDDSASSASASVSGVSGALPPAPAPVNEL